MAGQNTSHAVMAQRHEGKDSLDDFPTPPWATRALLEQHLLNDFDIGNQTCLEPACGRGYMATPLAEYFAKVTAHDVYPYGYGEVCDFLDKTELFRPPVDWVITNPPFRRAEDFFFEASKTARVGIALLVRTVFIESVGRYQRIFAQKPPAFVAQFCERVAMVKGRVDPKASTATGYAWIVWTREEASSTELRWIQPCRKRLENPRDYTPEFLRQVSAENLEEPDLFSAAG